MLAGIAWQENRQMQHKVEGLEQKVDGLYRANQEKTETLIRMEGKFDLLNRDNKDLKDMIQRLEQRLESKKVVNILGSSDPIVGDRYIEK
jgi:chromosome segregation ATPase